MRAVITIVFILLASCKDSTGPDAPPLHDRFLIRDIDGTQTPTVITPPSWDVSVKVVAGEVRCPSEPGSPAEEFYDLFFTLPTNDYADRITFEVDCEVLGSNEIRYTYPATGEIIVGQVWKGVGSSKGDVFQRKRLPSRETFTATIPWVGGFPIPDTSPVAMFRRFR